MEKTGPEAELAERATAYAELSKDDLFIELDRLMQPTSYAVAPTRETKKHEGESLWLRLRPKLAALVCRNRVKGGNAALTVLITTGGSTFIQEIAKLILGSGMLPGMTAAIAAAAAGLLYKEVQSGIDDFCEAHYVPEDTD